MTDSIHSPLAEPTSTRLDGRDKSRYAPQAWESRHLGGFERLIDALVRMVTADRAGREESMATLAYFFGADAAGLYVVPQPGRPMELTDSYNLTSSAPSQLGNAMQTGGKGHVQSITQCHVLDARDGIWARAAQAAGWQEVIVYTLPRCSASLVLAYGGPAAYLAAGFVKASLQSLALSVRHRQALARIRSLRQQRDELDHLVTDGFNRLSEAAVILDSDGKVISCNLLAGQLLGYAIDEILGMPADGFLVSRGDLDQYIQRVLSGRSSLEEHHLTLYQRYGETLPVRMRIAPLRVPGRPAPYGAVVFFSDRGAEQTEVAESGLRQKNVQLERMMSILAHEIRNPLASIKAGLEYLEPTLSHDEDAREDLKAIQSEIHRLNRLLTDALLISRRSEPKTSPQSITDLLDGLLAGRQKLLSERGIAVRKSYQPDLPSVQIDRAQMEQVFDNLIVNAIHAMPDGGDLSATVAASTGPADDPLKRHPTVEIKIGDSGPGIPPEIQERIFDPFFTTKRGGTGLGLAVARRIVGQHYGTLGVESWPGIGSIFVVTLPMEDTREQDDPLCG